MRVKSGPLEIDFTPPVVNFQHLRVICQKCPFSKKYPTLMSLVIKNVHSLKNTELSCNFFHVFHEKPSAVMHIQKTSILSKLQIIMGQKVQKNKIFPIFHEKITPLVLIFCQKNVHSKRSALMPTFCPKNVHSLKKHSFFI